MPYVIGLDRSQKLSVRFTTKKTFTYFSIEDGNGNELKIDKNGYAQINTSYKGDYYIHITTKYGQAENFNLKITAR